MNLRIDPNSPAVREAQAFCAQHRDTILERAKFLVEGEHDFELSDEDIEMLSKFVELAPKSGDLLWLLSVAMSHIESRATGGVLNREMMQAFQDYANDGMKRAAVHWRVN